MNVLNANPHSRNFAFRISQQPNLAIRRRNHFASLVTTSDSTSGQRSRDDLFVTTRWTVILDAGQRSTPRSDRALQELCTTYWFPLYAYVRSRGHIREDAEDLTQTFFARLLAKNYLAGLDSEKGRFRAFLLAAMKHFLANEWDRASAQKRGGGVPNLSLDWHSADSLYQITPSECLGPDKLYDRTWSITLLERVIDRLREESAAEGKADIFGCLKDFLMLGGNDDSYADAVEKTGLSTGAIRVAVHRLRKRYRELLRDEIAQTLSDPAQVEEEMQTLFRAFTE
jgi:RNA polymerase sigma-70 factor (ECF subfamily)